MTKIQLSLNEKEDMIVDLYKTINKLTDKRDAIKRIIIEKGQEIYGDPTKYLEDLK